MHALHAQVVGQGAVAGDLDSLSGASYDDLVNIDDLGEVGACSPKIYLKDFVIAIEAHRLFDGGGARSRYA